MRCIFCLESDRPARSVEHIIPESLGNTEHVLPRGVVCDLCNNYLARKVEKPLLDSIHFMNLRGRNVVPNKRGMVPPQYGFCPGAGTPVGIQFSSTEGLSIGAWDEADDEPFVKYILGSSKGCVLVPLEARIDERVLARFLGKIGYEILAQRLIAANLDVDALSEQPELALLRRFVRQGDVPDRWPVHRRRIYREGDSFQDDGQSYEVLHEYTLLCTDQIEIYAIVCLFGEEFVINLGGPSIEGYERWIANNQGRSPLY
ncbi:HNH endonuclease [Methylocystis hirsuta]|uniref:HNH endonuclease n=1 Tax=Methylocystis hirsuta TaxID=369798 RepID=A0A3M9XPM2_9HYPH|nr:HNH endonuclease [Methylocystis hirsuta]RNJ49702.1 HNH endonuclease [Methylocystis hirsuta]